MVLHSPGQISECVSENDSYLLIGDHLRKCTLPVPRIYMKDLRNGFFLMDDLGDYHLADHACRHRSSILPVYRRVVRLLLALHYRAPDGFDPSFCFDTAVYSPDFVYERELEYFREFFLNGCLALKIGEEELQKDFLRLSEAAGVRRISWVMHRDFQSRNIMICGGRLWIIDFQGMRFGPPLYDLASLLLDPYVQLPGHVQKELVKLYWLKARSFLEYSVDDFWHSYLILRLCRNLQVLGAYSKLGLVLGKKSFLNYIPYAWQQLRSLMARHFKETFPDLWRIVKEDFPEEMQQCHASFA